MDFKKCHFLKTKIEYLGHIIENQKISPSPSKTQAVTSFPIPINLKQLQSFLGLVGYFRKFIANFSQIAKPLSDMTKQDAKIQFGDQQLDAFNRLKILITQKPVLKIFHQQHETELHTDASIDGFGVVLLQKSPDDKQWHPVYYMSKKTTDAERKFTSYELEILAVVEAFKKFRVYLLRLRFRLVTDCNALAKTVETNMCKVSSAHAFMCITVEANNTNTNTIWLPIPRLKILTSQS